MPFYQYRCSEGHKTEELRKVDNRRDPIKCSQCDEAAELEITAVAFDNLGMGVDSGFPTAWSRWETLQRAKNTGKMWDSNNNRYGGEYEKSK
jgi:putative FmdB family regulatory protein